MTDRCRAHADVWRDVFGLSDEQVADAIRQDRIDILVDLTMHMANNRLLVFARKPAPVQVTYLAYCGTTGLRHDGLSPDRSVSGPAGPERAVLLRAVDPPAGDVLVLSADGSRLRRSMHLPALQAGHVTFGSLNNFCKVTPRRWPPGAGCCRRCPVEVAPARPRRQPSRPGAEFFWPSKASRRSG